jgi:hypothetical protein
MVRLLRGPLLVALRATVKMCQTHRRVFVPDPVKCNNILSFSRPSASSSGPSSQCANGRTQVRSPGSSAFLSSGFIPKIKFAGILRHLWTTMGGDALVVSGADLREFLVDLYWYRF